MSEMSGKYKQIMQDLESNIKNPETLEFVKNKFSDLSMLFIDIIDRITNLTDARIKEIEEKQTEITNRMNQVQTVVDGIENDIYEGDENYEFEIVCPYCNYEFTADIEDENKEEIQCPECHNTIELDWNPDELDGCSGSCSSCHSQCSVAEEEEEYKIEDDEKSKSNKKDKKNNEEDDEDM